MQGRLAYAEIGAERTSKWSR